MDDSNIEKFIAIVNSALNCFNREERYLIENDLSERCVCARFAMHLTSAIEKSEFNRRGYVVDVEYNRGADGYERATKRIDGAPITVDLIVHKRGYDCDYGFDNLICIEMKKSKDRRGCSEDEDRLRKMTGFEYGFHYKAGFMIIVDQESVNLHIKTVFRDGKEFRQGGE